jgi:hypothetical protein
MRTPQIFAGPPGSDTKSAHFRGANAGTVAGMDEAEAVLARLERIEALEREGAPAAALVGELRSLVQEAEAWVRHEGDERAAAALERCRSALAGPVTAR